MNDNQKLGIVSAISYFVGDIIGSGIFVSPTGIVQYSGSVGLSLIVWTGCGLLSFLGALCYIELGTSIPYSGGDFAYLCFYGWQPLAFAFLWTYFIIYKPCTVAILVKTFGSYIIEAVSPLLDLSPTTADIAEKLFGILLLLLLMWINFFQLTKYAARIQVVVSTFKVLSLGIIIVTGIVYMCQGNTSNLQNAMAGSIVSPNLVLAINSGLWSFDGWDSLNFGVEELKNPRKTLLVSTVAGMIIVIVVYLATNVAYFAVLGVDTLKNSTAVAETFSQDVLGGFSYAVPVIVGIVIMGSLNSSLFTSSRYFYAAARQGHLPSFMKLLHVTQFTPQSSLVTFAIMGVIMINIASVNTLINYATFVVWLQRVFTISGLMWIRIRKWPVKETAVKIPFVIHVVFFLCTVLLVVVQTYTAWLVTLIGVGVALMGLIIYFLLIYPDCSPKFLRQLDASVMKFCQIIFYSMPETTNIGKRDDVALGVVNQLEANVSENNSRVTVGRVTIEKF